MRVCYIEWGDGTACQRPAAYEGRLAWTGGVMLLCEEHAAAERAHGDVVEIHTLPRNPEER